MNNQSSVFTWTKEYALEVLTQSKNAVLKTPKVIEAFAHIDRNKFVALHLKSLAYQDIDIELGNGETFTRISTLAQIAENLQLKEGGVYLDLGTGTGFFALIMGFVAGSKGKVYSIERIKSFYNKALNNAGIYKDIQNVYFIHSNGKDGLIEYAPYDGIHISYALEFVPKNILDQLKPNGGRLVYPSLNHDIRVIERNGDSFEEEIIPGFVFQGSRDGIQ